MTTLYSDLAYLYDAMYQTFIDYDAEFTRYTDLLKQYGAKSVFEIGCCSGHLAKRFTEQQYEYTGIDVSPQMLAIARISAWACNSTRLICGHFRLTGASTRY